MRVTGKTAMALAIFGGLLLPFAATSQTISPTPVQVALISTNTTSDPALNNAGEFTATLYSSPNTPLPAALPAGNYPAWCGTRVGDAYGSNTYTATTTPPASNTVSPAALSDPNVWNEINYALNHKAGYMISDVQAVIWTLLTTLSPSTLQSRQPSAYPLYQAAVTNGTTFTPALGQTHMVLLLNPTAGSQHIIVELLTGGAIGDRVWQDPDANGIQDTVTLVNPSPIDISQSFGYYSDGTSTYSYQFKSSEPGINGVRVDLYSVDSTGAVSASPIASTTTANSPASYPYLPPGTSGWYQFTGLVAGSYQVRIDVTQPEIGGRGFVPTAYYKTTTNLDSNDPINGANTTLTGSMTPPVDETLDFGFTGSAPLQVTCASNSGRVGTFYSSTVTASGGVPPYTFSLAGGALPDGLTLHATTGVIDGTPTVEGPFSFTVQVKDSSNLTSGTVTSACGITIAKALTLACASGAAQVGNYYSSSIVASNGTAPYTYSALDPLPDGLALNASTGAITGSPTAAGLFSFRAQAVDATGTLAGTVSTRCAINVAPVNPTPTCIANSATVGVGYFSKFGASGGSGTGYTFAIVNGSLPPGLSIDTSTWSVNGTPTTNGAYAFTIQVTDSSGAQGSISCSIVVKGLTVICAAGSGFVGPFSSSVNVTGGSGQLTYSITAGALPTGLTLNASTGAISGSATTAGSYSFTVTVVDNVSGATASAACTIQIYNQPTLLCNAGPSTVGGSLVGSLVASGGAGHYSYSLAAGTPAWISLNSTTGALSGTPSSPASPLAFTGMVTDSTGGMASTSSAACTITVNPPAALSCAAALAAGVVGTPFTAPPPVLTGGTPGFTYSTSGTLPANLRLNADGSVTGTPISYGSFSVQAADSNGVAAVGSCPVTILPAPYVNCAVINAVQGVALTGAVLTGSGGTGGAYTFLSATNLPPGLTLNADGTITGTPMANGTYTIAVTLKDAAGHIGTSSCTIVVTGGNNCGLTWGYWKNHYDAWPASIKQNGLTIGGVTYSGVAGGDLQRIFSLSVTGDASLNLAHQLIAAWLNVYNGTNIATDQGAIMNSDALLSALYNGKPIAALNGAAYPALAGLTFLSPMNVDSSSTLGGLMVTYAGQLDNFNSDGLWQPNCSIPGKLAVKCAASTGQVGVAYNSAVVASGGMAPYTFSIASGSLPAGLTLDPASGAITGTPTEAGTFNFSVQVADSTSMAGSTAGIVTTNCTITIAPPAPPVVACPPNGQVGVDYNPFTLGVTNYNGTYTFAVSGFGNSGLSYNSNKGWISGTGLIAGTYSITISIYDSTGALVNTQSCTIVIQPPPLVILCPALTGIVGTAYNSGFSSMGGVTPYTFSIALGALPDGLTLNATTGAITGTPAKAGIYSFTGQVVDHNGTIVKTTNCTITIVAPPLTLLCPAVSGQVGSFYSSALVAGGGTPGYIYSIASGALPAGLTLNPTTGAITGTPLAAGTATFTAKVTDSATGTAVTTTANCSITISNPPLTLQCASSAAAVNTAYSSAVAAAGGAGGYTYSIALGSLPPGLALNATTGVISGTPGIVGSYSFTVKAVDTTGNWVTSSCSITVASNICGLTWGYWKNHVSLWPQTSLTLGSQTYSQSQLTTILGTSVSGDASVDLAHQLIAAKLNVLNGTPGSTANGAIDAADKLLAAYAGYLPYKVGSSTAAGQQMTATSSQLNTFNSDGKAQPGCTMSTSGANGTIGNFVWFDANGNGIQDLNEPGIAGVTVHLRDANNTLLATTTTDANGTYQFTGLSAATYIVDVVTPAGYAPTTAYATTPDADSNRSPEMVVVPLGASSNMTIDFGFTKPSCSGVIGQFVWRDSNGNGVQDSGEPGIPGVLVKLLSGSTLLQTAMTDSLGVYQFTGVCSGTYTVTVATPAGYVASPSLAGSDRTKDSNGSPASVTLATSTSSDLTIGFGFKPVTSTSANYTTYTQGGWGAPPNGNNAGSLLYNNFDRVYPNSVVIGGGYKLTFTSAQAVEGFLPAGGTAAVLTAGATNPTATAAGVLGGQVLALQLAKDFSHAGITKTGLENLKVTTGKYAGQSVNQVLSIANAVLGGDTSKLLSGTTIADLVSVLDSINQDFDGGTVNNGYLQ